MDDAQTWRRVFSKMTGLQHESDDDALSFQRLSNWQDACISTCESEADRSQRTRRDSQFQTLSSIPAWKSKPSWVAVATKDRTINPDLERWYATRAHSHKIEVVGASHSVYTSRPKQVAALIEDAATHAR
jgi:pimeloyl-ACP methyl ester carboxylesterase